MSILKSSIFYDKFHQRTVPQNKFIDEINFTYRPLSTVLDNVLNRNRSLKILDFGCGSGSLALLLSKKGHLVTGIDISVKAVQAATQTARNLNKEKECEFYTLEEGIKKTRHKKFDVVLCIEVLEHLKRENSTLRFFHRHLKRSGLLVISVPSKNAPLFRMGLLTNFDTAVGHVRRYSDEEISHLLATNNFSVLERIKTEGVIRNSLFTIRHLGFFIRFIKGFLVNIVTALDNRSMVLFGESDLILVARKR